MDKRAITDGEKTKHVTSEQICTITIPEIINPAVSDEIINELCKCKGEVTLLINSYGGKWNSIMAIVNTLKYLLDQGQITRLITVNIFVCGHYALLLFFMGTIRRAAKKSIFRFSQQYCHNKYEDRLNVRLTKLLYKRVGLNQKIVLSEIKKNDVYTANKFIRKFGIPIEIVAQL